MRLTLRTMLAFLDDVLEGPDAKELEQKIDESKFASDLVHRIRGSIRHLRLGAPKLHGKGMGADANTVAEYLDNTMPPERVPDFEKVCLESDVQLAEVAACHQVLTIVLGEPAAVDPAIRDRMYGIGHPEAQPAAAHNAAHNAAHDGNGTTTAQRPAPVAEPTASAKAVHAESEPPRIQPARTTAPRSAKAQRGPEESAFPLKSLALTLFLFFVVTGVALRAIAPIDANHPVWVLIAGKSESPQVADSSTASTAAGKISPQPENNPATTNTSNPSSTSSTDAKRTESAAPIESGKANDAAKVVPVPESTGQPAPGTPPAVISAEPPIPPTTTVETPPAKSNVVPAPVGGVPATSIKPPVDASPVLKAPEVATTPVNVGRYISEGQILARMDAEKNAWMVMPPETTLSAGERLLSLPTCRPQILVAPTVKVTMAGEAFLKLHVPEAGNSPRVTVEFGRVVLVPVGEMENTVQVDFGGRGGQLKFADVESLVAIEVHPFLPVGANPTMATPNLIVQMWATAGGAEWQEPERPAVRLSSGQRLQFIDEAPVAVVNDDLLPDWIDGKNVSDLDRRASQVLRTFLTTDRPLALSLMEQTNYRQVEVRALSCRSLCYLGVFEPAIAALGDSQHRLFWNAEIAAIQTTLPFGPESVDQLRKDIEKVYGKDMEKIFRMLQGYSPEQLTTGGGAELVEALENELMAIRVLAFISLVRITDKTFYLHPDERPEVEKARITRWRKLLEEGQLVYKNPPLAIPQTPPDAPPDAPK